MQFIVRAYDGEGKLDKRLEVRPAHLEGIKKLNEQGHVIAAGGILDDEGKMRGSALVLDFDSRAELDDYLAHEIYATEKVWEKIEVDRMNVVFSNAVK